MKTKIKKIRRGGIYGESWKDPTYTTNYVVLVGYTMHDVIPVWLQLSGRKKGIDVVDTDAAFTDDVEMEDGSLKVFICFDFDATPGLVAHECNHAVNMTFKFHGIVLDVNNDEHQSYYLQSLVDRCWTVISGYEKVLNSKLKDERVSVEPGKDPDRKAI